MTQALVIAIISVLEFVELKWGVAGPSKEWIEGALMTIAPIYIFLSNQGWFSRWFRRPQ